MTPDGDQVFRTDTERDEVPVPEDEQVEEFMGWRLVAVPGGIGFRVPVAF